MNKKVISFVLTFFLLLNSLIPAGFIQRVFAQEEFSTSSADLTNDTTASSSGFFDSVSLDNSGSSSSGSSKTNTDSIPSSANDYFDNLNVSPTPLMLDNSGSQSSATLGNPVKVHALSRKSYKGDEKITVIVESAAVNDLKVKLFDVSGNEVPVMMENINTQNPAVVRLIPPVQFKAGRYRLAITDPEGNTTTQNFTWGVLAINTNKSIYLPDDAVNISIAVLDETGLMVCNADVALDITNSDLKIDDTLSTENGKITVNPECQIKKYTEKPDYEAHYQVGKAGYYDINLTAKTDNGIYSISDGFDVSEDEPFDVERVNATRLFPPVTYRSIFNITANQDFRGTITEAVPDTFAVSPIDGIAFADNLATVSGSLQAQGTINNEVPHLSLPFDRNHPISQKFGQELGDPIENKKYEDYGVIGHDGVDFDMPEGAAVLAVDDGEVARADVNGDYGQTIVIEHSWGKSYYGHLSLITAQVGQKILKGHPIGLSGSSGLSTFPHLHFGIKPVNFDVNNGYFGKINPLPYLGFESVMFADGQNQVFSSNQNDSYMVKTLTWKVDLRKGDKIKLGYNYMVPNVSPQFYLLGPLQFRTTDDELIFQEQRQWQLAVDADGSGTNTVNPATGQISATGQTYAFTYTTGESVATGSGAMTIQVPSGWTTPQTSSSSTAGYTTISASSTGVSGDLLDNADSVTNWNREPIGGNTNNRPCGDAAPTLDATIQPQGAGDIKCVNAGVSVGNGFYKSISSSNWTNYTTVGAWIRTSSAQSTLANLRFSYDDTAALASPIANISLSTPTAANTWTWETFTLTGTRNAIVSYGFTYGSSTALDNVTVSVDYILIGPGTPVVTGSGPWTITTNIVTIPATTGTIIVNYGQSGAGAVTNSSTLGAHTFTTQSKIATNPKNVMVSIGSHPTVTLSSGPTLDQLMRHGKWFDGGAEQPFTF